MTKEKHYTLENGINDACRRAARDREGSFVVFVDKGDVVVQDARALLPQTALVECICQFWKERENGMIEVQIRRNGAQSEWVEVDIETDIVF